MCVYVFASGGTYDTTQLRIYSFYMKFMENAIVQKIILLIEGRDVKPCIAKEYAYLQLQQLLKPYNARRSNGRDENKIDKCL